MARSGYPPLREDGDFETLALDLSSVAVRLLARTEFGSWVELGTAPLAADDFVARVGALRDLAERRTGAPRPVALWLPPDQVILREYRMGRFVRPRGEALRRLAAEGIGGDLSIAVTRGVPGGPVTVLAVPVGTVRDARAYAGRWGFVPGRVSTRVEAARFGRYGPVFELPDAPVRHMPRAAVGMAAAAALAVAVGLGAWGLQPSGSESGSGGVEQTAAVSSEVLQPARRGIVQASFLPLEWKRQVLTEPERLVAAGLAGPVQNSDGAEPLVDAFAELAKSGVRASAPSDPSIVEPRLALAGKPGLSTSADRLPKFAPADRDRGADRENGLRFSMLSEAVGPAKTTGDFGAAPAPALAGPAVNEAEETIVVPAAEAAAENVVAAVPVEGAAQLILAAARGVSGGVPVPPKRPGTAAGAASPEPAVAPGTGSELAVERAPRPAVRPRHATPADRTMAHRAMPADASPDRVRRAASMRGLALSATSLIGVLEGRSGRQALIRTANGGYQRVARGDTVEGWRVSTIGRDAITLTKSGQNRTLPLVAR